MENKSSHPHALYTLFGLTAILIWSASVGFARSLSEKIGPITAAALVYAIGGALGLAYQALKDPDIRSTYRKFNARYLLICGALFAAYMVCFYLSLGLSANRADSLRAGLINYLWPLFILLFSIPLLKTRPGLFLVPGALMAFGGIIFSMTGGTFNLGNLLTSGLPGLLAFAGAILWGLYANLSRKWAGDAKESAIFLFMAMTGLLLLGIRLFLHEETLWSASAFFELFFLAILSNLAYFFFELSMRKGDIVLVASASNLTPVLSVLAGGLYLGYLPGPQFWIGAILVSAGSVICKLSLKERA
jgi:drug/metabolite transporter (DMT)-like permease